MTHEAPAIVKLSERVLVEIEQAVRGFARSHKYAVGAELRETARNVARLAQRAWRNREEQRERIGCLVIAIDDLKLDMQVAKRIAAFKSFAQFEAIARLVSDLGRQCGGWQKQQQKGQNQRTSTSDERAQILSARRWWLVPPSWRLPFSIRVHHILLPDADPYLHDHPWDWRTIILDGWYSEENVEGQMHTYCEGDTRAASAETLHRIDEVSVGGVWTLFIMRHRRNRWGFMCGDPPRKIYWADYESQNGRPNLVGHQSNDPNELAHWANRVPRTEPWTWADYLLAAVLIAIAIIVAVTHFTSHTSSGVST